MAASPDLQTPLHPSSEPEKIPLKTGTQEKNAPSQLLPETPDPSTTHVQHELIIKGFTAISVAGAFVASIQSQVMSTTLSANPETKALRSINAFYLVGVILDIISALLAFLSARWFERLTEQEKDLLETVYAYHNLHPDEKALATSRPMRPWETGDRQWLYYSWLGLSLDIPLILLVLGTTCMMVGICIYAWSQHPTVVASFVTLAISAPLPFIVGVSPSEGKGIDAKSLYFAWVSCKETGSVCHILAPSGDWYIGTFSSIPPLPLVMWDCGKVDDRELGFHFLLP